MTTILMTAYAVDPYKGSEEGTGWNLVYQTAKRNHVIVVTRKNNRTAIERYMAAHQGADTALGNMQWLYFDLPRWAIVWKKGPLLSALYFYVWQLGVALWLLRVRPAFNIAHSVNFHSNWTPSFLWLLGKPFVWGPVGNHPTIPAQYLKVYGKKALLKDRLLWAVKWCFWNLDPFLYACRKKAVKVFCVNTQAVQKLRLPAHKVVAMPAVATEPPLAKAIGPATGFTVLSAGRFVPLKGFDLTIRSFAKFYRQLDTAQQAHTKLLIVGTGPQRKLLQQLIAETGLGNCITLMDWLPRAEVIQLFQQASVFLFPSHEGAGMVVAEALSYGLPVVCLRNHGPGEYVHPHTQLAMPQCGYTDTVQQMAQGLWRLYTDAAFYESESRLAQERYASLFTWEAKGLLMQSVYDAVLQPGAPAITPTQIPSI